MNTKTKTNTEPPQIYGRYITIYQQQQNNRLRYRVGDQGGTLILSYIRRLGSLFGFKILNFNIFGGFQKKKIWGYKNSVDIFGGHHKIGLYLEVISMHFRVFP